MNELDLAYLAGIVDGEGCITICKNTKVSRRPRYQLVFKVAMYDTEPLDLLVEVFGGKIEDANRTDKKPVLQYSATGYAVGNIASILLPYLKSKYKEAKLAIEFCYLHTGKRGWHVSDAELEEKERLYQEMHQLVIGHKSKSY